MSRRREYTVLTEVLSDDPVSSSAPCRVDCGGTWDLSAFWLPYRDLEPATVNLAISLRTHVTLRPLRAGWIRVSSVGFDGEEYPVDEVPFNTPLGLAFAVATYFGVSGVHIDVRSESPPRSGLGGSGTVGVALVHAFSRALSLLGLASFGTGDVARLAYQLEDGLSVSLTGMQDQAAAAYGGANLWKWGEDSGFAREELLTRQELTEMSRSFLVAYSGESHRSVDVNARWLEAFLSGRNRHMWFAINDLTWEFARALREGDVRRAGCVLNEETLLRQTLTREVLTPLTKALATAASELGCGARFVGSGGGGCVWAVGEEGRIDAVRERWKAILESTETGRVLDASLEGDGVR